MSTSEATPNRCYCRIQDEEVNLNEIAKIITVLNSKIVRLRNEVSALKNVGPVRENQSGKKFDDRSRDLPRRCCCARERHASVNNVELDKSTVSEKSKVLAELFGNNLKEIDNKVSTDASHVNNLAVDDKLRINRSKPVSQNAIKRKRKKISRGIQCDSAMERKRKRNFLNCFKTESNINEEDSSKQNKKLKFSSINNVHSNTEPEAEKENFRNAKKRKDEDISQLHESYAHGEGSIAREKINQACTLIKIEPKKEKLQETTMINNELAEYKLNQLKDTVDEQKSFQYSINRMAGGAEIRGNRLIADFADKMQKINLYKNVKFDARNVKKRLDACIVELNEIIEDVSLILPKADTSKKLQK